MIDKNELFKYVIIMFCTSAFIRAIEFMITKIITDNAKDIIKRDGVLKRINFIYPLLTMIAGGILGAVFSSLKRGMGIEDSIFYFCFFLGGMWIIYSYLFKPILEFLKGKLKKEE